MPTEDNRQFPPDSDDDWSLPDDDREFALAGRDENGVPFSIPRD